MAAPAYRGRITVMIQNQAPQFNSNLHPCLSTASDTTADTTLPRPVEAALLLAGPPQYHHSMRHHAAHAHAQAPVSASASQRFAAPTRGRNAHTPCIAALAACILSAFATPAVADRHEAKYSGDGTEIVLDTAANDGEALAIRLAGTGARHALAVDLPRLAPGLYHIHVLARLHHQPGDDLSDFVAKLDLDLTAGTEPQTLGAMQFNSDPARYTRFTTEHLIRRAPSRPAVTLQWALHPHDGRPAQPLHAQRPPDLPQARPRHPVTATGGGADAFGDLGDELAELVTASSAKALAELREPALLIDAIEIERIAAGQVVTRVWPAKVRVEPGQPNPIAVTVANLTSEPVQRKVRLRILTGLDELVYEAQQTANLPARGETNVTFDWTAGDHQFGHAAIVTVSGDGTPVHQAAEIFSVSDNIWKVAIQGNGFILWAGREASFPDHVARNRENYINVEEAFSWQPSSWDDLTPDRELWWTGQNDYHNSLSGLRAWIELSHGQGISMISYLWPTASGPRGFENARRHPELMARGPAGMVSEFHDVMDLDLWDRTAADPRLWDLRSGIWNSIAYNRGMLRTIDVMVQEVLASAAEFGWDGVRFDKPPSWSAMPAALAREEARELDAEKLLAHLMPDSLDTSGEQWSGTAISTRNVLYTHHQFRQADPNFAISYNTSLPASEQADPESGLGTAFFEAQAAGGGQLMDEAIRHFADRKGSWEEYAQRVLQWVQPIRAAGGFHCAVALDGADSLARAYAAIFVLAGGSHPYLDFGWRTPMPGAYNHFATRYGELLWHPDLRPITPAAAGIAVLDDQGLWWKSHLTRRVRSDGMTRTIMHLITEPPTPHVNADPQKLPRPWRDRIALRLSDRATLPAAVWVLSAEPRTRARQIEPRRQGDAIVLEVSDHRLWSVVVIDERRAP